MKILLPIMLALLLVACAAENNVNLEIDPEPEPAPEPVAVPVTPQQPETMNDTGAEPAAEPDEWAIPKNPLTDIVCDNEEKRLTFTLTNTDEQLWEFGIIHPFPPPTDRQTVRIFINGQNVEANDFGFDCVNESMEPGASVECELQPIPIVTPNAYTRNYLQIQGNTINDQVTFECE